MRREKMYSFYDKEFFLEEIEEKICKKIAF